MTFKKTFHSLILGVAAAGLIFATGCSRQKTTTGNLLSQSWTHSAGRFDDTIENAKNYFYMPIEDLDRLNEKAPMNPGYVWLKNEFDVPDSFKAEQIAASLGRITIADKTYLNGVLIGAEGIFPPNFFSAWNLDRLYPIPNTLLKKGKNTLLIKVYVNGEGSVFGTLYLGSYDKAKAISDLSRFFYSTINAIISFLVLMIGILYLAIYLKRRKDRENLFFALLCIVFSLNLSTFFMTSFPKYEQFPLSYLTYQKTLHSFFCLNIMLGVFFIHDFIRIPLRRPFLMMNVIALAIPVLIFWFQPDYEAFNLVKGKAQLFLAIPFLYLVVLLIIGIYRRVPEIWILILGLSPLIATNAYDIIFLQIMKMPGWIYLSGYGFPAFIFAMAAILTNRFIHDRTLAEELNISLEQKVEERTSELRSVNDELERTNDTLTLTNRELETAQRIAARDMKIAVNVQQSLLAKKPPENPEWEIAFDFRPMSGVSGDLYDFYLDDDGILLGVGLFDVSGHGISSGLITLLAKSVIYRNFMNLRDEQLHGVLQNINAELIRELGSVDNYLTGIMLRFVGDTVEYVNAGHTELILRRGRSGARIIQPKNDDIKGHFLGVKEMEAQYRSLAFKTVTDDCIFIYSDCLIEAHNLAGEAYGMDRLMEFISNLKSGLTASAILSSVMEDFNSFTGKKQLNDDLSIIVLKRL
jgi:phosphoserine phosphatase RsbU/P